MIVVALLLGMAQAAVATAEPGALAPRQDITGPAVLHHDGRMRVDTVNSRGGVTSEYRAVSQSSTLYVERDRDGRVREIFIMEEERGLLPREAQPATAEQVRPPFDLMNLTNWAAPEAFRDAPGRSSAGDYEVELREPGQAGPPRSGVVERRSGAWVSRRTALDAKYAELYVVNDNLGLEFRYRSNILPRLHIALRRGRASAMGFPWTLNEGPKSSEVILGQTCRWQSRSTSPDAGETECRTADGVLLAARKYNNFGSLPPLRAVWLRRAPVALVDVLPPAEVMQPERHGLSMGGETR